MAEHRSQPSITSKNEAWTTRRLLKWMTDHFAAKEVDSPRIVAEMLLSHVLQCERMRLYMDVDRPASAAELAQLRELTAQAAKHEPVQYLVGEAWFFARRFSVNRSTLIPRPCTEVLVEQVLQWRRLNPAHANPLIADIGTGTGCIGITLALQWPDARVIATDIIPEAIELAQRNAAMHNVTDRMEFRLGPDVKPLMEAGGAAIPGERFDVIVSNPPYISDHEWTSQVDKNVKGHEPDSALRGGTDGLDVIRLLITKAPHQLRPGGLLAIEIAHSQRDRVVELAAQSDLLENPTVVKDHEGYWRVFLAAKAT